MGGEVKHWRISKGYREFPELLAACNFSVSLKVHEKKTS